MTKVSRRKRSALATICSGLLAAIASEKAWAQITLPDRAMRLVSSSIPTPSDRQTRPSIWRFRTPISYSYISADHRAAASEFIHESIVSALYEPACLKDSIDSLEKYQSTKKDGPDPAADAVKRLEAAYLKEKGLSPADLETWKQFRARYRAELDRLAALPKATAAGEAYKLQQIEAEWNVSGFRADFRELERRLASLPKAPPAISAAALRREVFGDDGKIKFRLSVPVGQWGEFDSWVNTRRSGGPETQFPLRNATSRPGGAYNEGSCVGDECSTKLTGSFATPDVTSVSFIAPQLEAQWLSKFRNAMSSVEPPIKDCTGGWDFDRVVIVTNVATSFNRDRLADLLKVMESGEAFSVDGVQFAGYPNLGLRYRSSPTIRDGLVLSPFFHILGFSTRQTPSAAPKP